MADYQIITETDIAALRRLVGDGYVSRGESHRELHAHDESFHETHRPDVVVWPHSTADVQAVVRLAAERRWPVTPWGAGSSLEGNPIPVSGGIVLDMQEMNRILDIRETDFQVDVQAGVIYKELNQRLQRQGLFFPPDPGASATVGGMIANNASGIRTVKYGPTKDYVQRLTVVLADGRVIPIGNRARKSSSGYDLCRLFTGSEGTLGIVTEATLRLVGLPEKVMAVRAAFPAVENASQTVFEVMSSGLTPSAMEFLDGAVMGVLNRDRGLDLEEKPTLLMEFHGFSEQGLQAELELVEDICRANGCVVLDRGIGPDERHRLWEMRHLTVESIKRVHPALHLLIMDVAVPLSRYSDMVTFIEEETRGFTAYVFGHAGDGNIHVVVMDDHHAPDRWCRVQDLNRRIVLQALEYEGTCTGEHGIGIGKREFMRREHGPGLDLMRDLKSLLDPQGILNPGKIFPPAAEE
ncbi:MAG: FAD-binding oxidoreductase [Acidobacteria bacterium]|nr:FAD-binding oxidoreductase [Acidobacteriota bacterium]